MKVAFLGYEPALTDGMQKTSAAGGLWLPALFSFLESKDIYVDNGSVGENEIRYSEFYNSLLHAEAFIIQWRWPMPRSFSRGAAFDRQMKALYFAENNGIPVLIHDEDYKDSEIFDRLAKYPNLRYKLTSPAFNPREGYSTLFYPFPKMEQRFLPLADRFETFAYIGNNYERYDQMKTYYGGWQDYPISIWGNWLEHSDERESPEQVVKDFPCVSFKGRLPQNAVGEVLSRSMFTHHFAKPAYCTEGFMTIRWFEAALSGCIGIAPDEFTLPSEWEDIFKFDTETIEALMMDEFYYRSVLNSQLDLLRTIDGSQQWYDLLVSLVHTG